MSSVKAVLSIDGGGIRGIIPAMILEALESDGTPISSMFDVVAGTSTGGILALGLTTRSQNGLPRYSASSMVDLYKTQAKTIFPELPTPNPLNFNAHFSKLQDLINKPTYNGEGLNAVLSQYFGNATLSNSLVEVLIPAYETVTREPFLFSRQSALVNQSLDLKIRDVALATSAAPTFFPPVKLELRDANDTISLVDGGVCANNPSLLAYRHAVELFPDSKILLISIGTGKYKRPLHHDVIQTWGPLKWVQPLIGVMFDGSDEVTHSVAQTVFDNLNAGRPSKLGETYSYIRLQVDIQEQNDKMDNSNKQNVDELAAIAKKYIATIKPVLKSIRDVLSESRSSQLVDVSQTKKNSRTKAKTKVQA